MRKYFIYLILSCFFFFFFYSQENVRRNWKRKTWVYCLKCNSTLKQTRWSLKIGECIIDGRKSALGSPANNNTTLEVSTDEYTSEGKGWNTSPCTHPSLHVRIHTQTLCDLPFLYVYISMYIIVILVCTG